LVAVTVNVDEFPELTEAGLAVMLTVGDDAVTVTVVVAVVVFPPVPVAVAVYVVVTVGLTACVPPIAGRL
jgi:phage shock protein PspC (stress-responsive transcriptional regulator)